MDSKPVIPHGENLRNAIRFVNEMFMGWNQKTVNEVSLRFDLSPLEEQFLLDEFVYHKGIGGGVSDEC